MLKSVLTDNFVLRRPGMPHADDHGYLRTTLVALADADTRVVVDVKVFQVDGDELKLTSHEERLANTVALELARGGAL